MYETERYTNFHYISGGCIGKVCKAEDVLNKVNVAVKIMNLKQSSERTKKNIYREICLLNHLSSKYTINIMDIYKIENTELLEICLVLPFMEYDLHQIIWKNKSMLRYFQIIKIIYQLILGLKYLYNCSIIHRDLKPSNIGINSNLDLRILDFGLARDLKDDMTNYVVTRWYRPLEVFYSSEYTAAVDMWSLGCITAELFVQKVLFKGMDEIDQVKCILSVCGFPDNEVLESSMENPISVFQTFKKFAASSNQLTEFIRADVEFKLLNDEDGDCQSVDDVMALISRMLDLNPKKRINPIEAQKSEIFSRHKKEIINYVEDETFYPFYCDEHSGIDSSKSWETKILEKVRSGI